MKNTQREPKSSKNTISINHIENTQYKPKSSKNTKFKAKSN